MANAATTCKTVGLLENFVLSLTFPENERCGTFLHYGSDLLLILKVISIEYRISFTANHFSLIIDPEFSAVDAMKI